MSRGRAITVWILLALATIVTLISSLVLWSKQQFLDTNQWTKSSTELLANPQIRTALSVKLVDLVSQEANIQERLKTRLPPAAQGAVPVLAGVVRSGAARVIDDFLQTQAAQTIWKEANRRAHATLVAVLEGHNVRNVSTANGEIVLDAQPMVSQVAARLGIHLPASSQSGQIVLMKSSQLKNAQHAVKVIHRISAFLVILVFVLYALAIYLARGQRRGVLMAAGGTLVGVGLVLLIIRRVVGNLVVDSFVKVEANKPAVHDVWLIETSLLRDIGLVLLIYGLYALVAGFLAGPSRAAVATRRTLAPTFRDHPVITYAVVIGVFLVLVAWGPFLSGRRITAVVVLFVLLLLGVEIWRRQSIRELEEAPGQAAALSSP
jgi:hypothetical protein